MITETELRHALMTKADGAPDLANIRTVIRARDAGLRRRSSARPVWVGLAAITVAIVVLGGVLLTGSTKGDGRLPATGPSTGLKLEYSYTVNPVPGFSIMQRDIYANRQTVFFGAIVIHEQSGVTVEQSVAQVDVYEPGQFDSTLAARGTPVTVHGRPGYHATVPVLLPNTSTPIDLPSVVWEYAPNAWAVAAGYPPPSEQIVTTPEIHVVYPAVQGADAELAFANAVTPERRIRCCCPRSSPPSRPA